MGKRVYITESQYKRYVKMLSEGINTNGWNFANQYSEEDTMTTQIYNYLKRAEELCREILNGSNGGLETGNDSRINIGNQYYDRRTEAQKYKIGVIAKCFKIIGVKVKNSGGMLEEGIMNKIHNFAMNHSADYRNLVNGIKNINLNDKTYKAQFNNGNSYQQFYQLLTKTYNGPLNNAYEAAGTGASEIVEKNIRVVQQNIINLSNMLKKEEQEKQQEPQNNQQQGPQNNQQQNTTVNGKPTTQNLAGVYNGT